MRIYNFNEQDAFRFAQHVGIKARQKGNELQLTTCPYCKADDKWTFSINLETGQFKCLRATCGKAGNMITLSKDFDFSLGESADEYYHPRKRYRNISKYPLPETRTPAIEYLETRGVPKEITERYHITSREKDEKVIAFPFLDEAGKLQFVKYRNAAFQKGDKGSKEWCESNCKPILFGMDQCDPEVSDALVMTEGQIDSLSVAACGIPNAISVPNGAKGFTWMPYCWNFLRKFKTLIIFGDHENGEITLLAEMKSRFHGQVKHVRPEDYLGCKDANELLQKYGKVAVADAIKNAVPVPNPHIIKLSDVIPMDPEQNGHISSGITELDKTIGAFYFGQLVILTGKRGLGKSTFGSQLLTRAVAENKNVFAYSGELDNTKFQDWFDRQCAGSRYIRTDTYESGGTAYSVIGRALPEIMDWYSDFAYMYDNTIMIAEDDTEEEKLIDTILAAIVQYSCQVIMIDNLMTAMDDDDPKSDIYRMQTRFVKQLAIMARQYNVLIILVAHPRKSGNDFDNDDVAGSSNITNLADIVLNYTEPTEKFKELYPGCKRMLQVTKNRLSGKLRIKEDSIPLWFEESSKRIADSEHGFGWKLGWEQAMQKPENPETEDFIGVEEDDLDTIPF